MLTADETLLFLEELKQILESGANRERFLETGLRLGASRARSDLQTALAALEAEKQSALENEDVTFQLVRHSLERKHERRASRILGAYRAQLKRTLDEISVTRDQAIYELQKCELFSHREADALRAKYLGFRDYLNRTAGRLTKMRSAALVIVGNTGGFRGLLGQRTAAAPSLTVEEGVEAMRSHLRASHELLMAFRDRKSEGQMDPAQAKTSAADLAEHLGAARSLLATLTQQITPEETDALAALEEANRAHAAAVDANYQTQLQKSEEMQNSLPYAIETQFRRIREQAERSASEQFARVGEHHATKLVRIREAYDQRASLLSQSQWDAADEAGRRYEEEWVKLETDWEEGLTSRFLTIQRFEEDASVLFPEWSRRMIEAWVPPSQFPRSVRLGQLDVNVMELAAHLPADPRLPLLGPPHFLMPLLLRIPEQASLLLETKGPEARTVALTTLNQVMLRTLAVIPPGRAAFTLIDPVGLGESFSGFMHLADYEESLVHSKIWTQPEQIDRRLAELGEHMEKVIQIYLRNEFESITQYNEKAGNIAERYRFLVIADFPNGFSEQAIQKLMSIATSGARCGVYTLIHWDRRLAVPAGLNEEDLRRPCVSLLNREGRFALARQPAGTALLLDVPPDNGLARDFIHRVGQASVDSTHVEVPFEQIAPPEHAMWSCRTTEELRVAIGRTGATKLQDLALGKATRQHALIAGKTGSGKSTLFHVIITNLSLWSSPEDVEFYLIDFKKGVEFKCYAAHRLPHARVVAIESDREFGLSVLQRVDEELRRRGELFRKLGTQDLPGYLNAEGAESLPRCLVMVDEFQEFFVEDDRISQTAALLLDRIVRQGRAFGIHVILGSQTLGGAFSMSRATLGQMVVRVALQCNESDSYLILDENNPAARLLSRPGEGIYNDAGGVPEANRPFQVVWLSEEHRDACLARVRARADRSDRTYAGPIVFEGNALAELSENAPLQQILASNPSVRPSLLKAFLGAPNSIKGPTAAEFQRLSGSHLLLISQNEESTLSLMFSSILSLAAQTPSEQVEFVVADGSPPETVERAHLDRFVASFPGTLQVVRHSDLETAFLRLQQEMKDRSEGQQSGASLPSLFLVVFGLQRFKKLRNEDELGFSLNPEPSSSPFSILQNILQEGPGQGIHVWMACDAFSNVQRFLGRKLLGEFDMRVAFQMSANDSAAFLDTPKAAALGLNRALFSNEQQGLLESFRPYSLPDAAWLEGAFSLLAQRTPS